MDGFVVKLSKPIDKFTTIIFKNGFNIACNMVKYIWAMLPPVSDKIIKIWYEVEQYRGPLLAPEPIGVENVDVLIGHKYIFPQLYKIILKLS